MRRWHIVAAAAVLCVAASCCNHPPPVTEKPRAAPVVLLTGFEPFGGSDFNTSWDAIKALDGLDMDGKRIKTIRLPVVWGEASTALSAAIKEYDPEVLVCFGMGTEHIQIELTARNERLQHPDNKGLLPPTSLISEDGPAAIETGIPVAEIQAALRELGLTCDLSRDAGGYLCNEIFYTCMAEAENRDIPVAGFIHVPVVSPESAGFEDFAAAIQAVVETCIRKTVASE